MLNFFFARRRRAKILGLNLHIFYTFTYISEPPAKFTYIVRPNIELWSAGEAFSAATRARWRGRRPN